jgi:lantibiotic transport system ATP-binding protein
MYCLETSGLVYRYRPDALVLDDISIRVPQRSIYGFLGPNGAGKTTTLRLVLGLLTAQQGSIAIFGKRLETHRIEILRQIGSLIESPSLYDHLTATENLRLLLRIYQVPIARIDEVLTLVGLSHTGRKKVSQFSLGMKQRLSLAVALLHRPSFLILDEPTNGLDPNGIVEIREVLTTLNREDGMTILVSSHLLAEIEKLVTHVGIIHRGRMMFQGTLDALRQKRRDMTSIVLRTNDNPRALEIIGHEIVPAAHIVDGEIRIPVLPPPTIAVLNRRLVEQGVDVYALHTTGDDLEAIFMDLVGN